MSSYPVTYVVDREGNIVGAPIYGNVKKQLETIIFVWLKYLVVKIEKEESL